VVLPKVQVRSTDISATQSFKAAGDQQSLDLPGGKPHFLRLPEQGLKEREAVVTATIKDLELEIEPQSKNGHPQFLHYDEHVQDASNRFRNRSRPVESTKHPERQRTVTWPSLQYKVWIDTSNLSFHKLDFSNRPSCSPRQCARVLSRQDTRKTVNSSHGRRIGSALLNKLEDTEFVIGSPEKWCVSSSHVRKGSDIAVKRAEFDYTRREKLTKPTSGIPRLPSRMGKNSLNSFLNTSKEEKLSNLIVHARVESQNAKKRPPAESAASITSPLRDPRTGPLKLRAFVRNPADHFGVEQEKPPKAKKVTISTRPGSRNEPSNSKNEVKMGAKKRLSFKIPSDWEVGRKDDLQLWTRAARESKKVVNGSDVPSIQAPSLHLDGAYHVTKYVTTK
jgi:hypothetical protein